MLAEIERFRDRRAHTSRPRFAADLERIGAAHLDTLAYSDAYGAELDAAALAPRDELHPVVGCYAANTLHTAYRLGDVNRRRSDSAARSSSARSGSTSRSATSRPGPSSSARSPGTPGPRRRPSTPPAPDTSSGSDPVIKPPAPTRAPGASSCSMHDRPGNRAAPSSRHAANAASSLARRPTTQRTPGVLRVRRGFFVFGKVRTEYRTSRPSRGR